MKQTVEDSQVKDKIPAEDVQKIVSKCDEVSEYLLGKFYFFIDFSAKKFFNK